MAVKKSVTPAIVFAILMNVCFLCASRITGIPAAGRPDERCQEYGCDGVIFLKFI